MAWKKTTGLVGKRFVQAGLEKAIVAGMVCKEAEKLFPGMFKAISVKNGVLTVAAPKSRWIDIKMIEGRLVKDLKEYSSSRGLPEATRVRTVDESPETP